MIRMLPRRYAMAPADWRAAAASDTLRPVDTQHQREELLGELELAVAEPVGRRQQPARRARLDRVAAVAGHGLRELDQERLGIGVQDVVQGSARVHLAAELRGVHPQRLTADLADHMEPMRRSAEEDRQPDDALGPDGADLDRGPVAQPDEHRGHRRLREVHVVRRRVVVGEALAGQDRDPLHPRDQPAGLGLRQPLEQLVPRALGTLPASPIRPPSRAGIRRTPAVPRRTGCGRERKRPIRRGAWRRHRVRGTGSRVAEGRVAGRHRRWRWSLGLSVRWRTYRTRWLHLRTATTRGARPEPRAAAIRHLRPAIPPLATGRRGRRAPLFAARPSPPSLSHWASWYATPDCRSRAPARRSSPRSRPRTG